MRHGQNIFLLFLLLGVFSIGAMDQSSAFDETSALIETLFTPHDGEKVEKEKKFNTLSVFKQQLSYHDRLKVDSATKTAAVDGYCSAKSKSALDETTKDLFAVATKKSTGAQSSGWVLKSETSQYILHPVHLAIKHGLHQCVKTLLSEGASSSTKDHLGRTPLHLLANFSDEDMQLKMFLLFVYYGSPIDAPNNQGDTPLTTAAACGALKFAQSLLNNNANPNIHVEAHDFQNVYACGTSPLWAAFSKNRTAVAQLLLSKNARIKQTERVAAQLLHDVTQDNAQKIYLDKALNSH